MKTRRFGTSAPRASARREAKFIQELAQALVANPTNYLRTICAAKAFVCWSAGPMVMRSIDAFEEAFRDRQPKTDEELSELAEALYWCEQEKKIKYLRWEEDDGVRAGLTLLFALECRDFTAKSKGQIIW